MAEEEAAGAAKASTEAPEVAATAARTRVGDGRLTGLVTEWKGHMGWVQPLSKVQHDKASWHRGMIYLVPQDVVDDDEGRPSNMKPGTVVDFLVYEDDNGLGAEECRQRSVLRMTLPHVEAKQVLKDSPQWSEYLSDSEHYPTFEREHGVLLRRYAWSLPFTLLELWGQTEALIAAAVTLAGRASGDSDECQLRLLLSSDDLSKAKSLPEEAKVSESTVLTRPQACHEVAVKASKEKCAEVLRAFLKVTAATA